MDHDFQRAQLIVGAYVEKGMFSEALTDKEKFRSVTPASSYWPWRAIIYGRSGQTEQAYHALHELLQSNQSHIDPIIIAWAYLGMGDKDQVLVWLEQLTCSTPIELVSVKVSPACDPAA